MENKYYRYPVEIQNRKTLIKFFAFLFLLFSDIVILAYPLADNNYQKNYYYLLLTVLMVIIGFIFAFGEYPDVKTDDNGLYVEFLWTYLPIPWEDITEIKHYSFLLSDWWLITTKNRLTFFHRLYSIYLFKSFFPSFYIHHKSSQDQADLLKLIRKQVATRAKAIRSS
ncbi:MAG: hypothetical protein IPP66_06625 [Anaerolineales bacterium]|nr:hypothetical protein [Anaerolineales bacterium]